MKSFKREVFMQAAYTWYGATDPNTGEAGVYHFEGDANIYPGGWQRSWVNNGYTKFVGFPYWDQETNSTGNYCVYIIYEWDPYPTGKRTLRVGPPGTSGDFDRYPFEYRSADDAYIGDYIEASETCYYRGTTGCIDWNSRCSL